MKGKIKKLRINEAGDFRDQNEIRKWNKVAGHLRKEHGIVTYTYTARTDLDFSKAPNIIVNGSNPGIRGAAREFRCISPKEYDNMEVSEGEYKCPGDCRIIPFAASMTVIISAISFGWASLIILLILTNQKAFSKSTIP